MTGPRLLVDDHLVSLFPSGVSSEVLTLFRPALAGDATIACSNGRVLLDRMDAMGVCPDRAMTCLEDALELAREAYDGLTFPGDGLGAHALAELDAFDWVMRLSFTNEPRAINWLISLVEECDPLLVLRLCLMARPTASVRLELPGQPELSPAEGMRLVVTQARADAETLNQCLRDQLPHLADLVRCAHLGGDESGEQLLAQLRGLAELGVARPITFVFRSSVRPVRLPEGFSVMIADEPDNTALLGRLLQKMGVRPAWHVG